jgi:hypothetical protein
MKWITTDRAAFYGTGIAVSLAFIVFVPRGGYPAVAFILVVGWTLAIINRRAQKGRRD